MTEEYAIEANYHIASLRALSDWLIANGYDMELPDAVDYDPADAAAFLADVCRALMEAGA